MKRFKRIMCVVDPEGPASHALERAVTLAGNNQADLEVVSLVEERAAEGSFADGIEDVGNLYATLLDERARYLESLVGPYRDRVNIGVKVLAGVPFLEIVREVLRRECDLVIKCAESPDWLDRLFGSDDMHLLRKCPCPVWMLKPREAKVYRRILVAIDLDDAFDSEEFSQRMDLNRNLIELGVSLVLSEFAELHIVHAWEAWGEHLMRSSAANIPREKIQAHVEQVKQQRQSDMDQLIDDVVNRVGSDAFSFSRPVTHLIKGQARKEIPRLAGEIDADLVIMGTIARTGVPGFIMGNTAEAILGQIACSVLAVKPDGFVTPVVL